MKLVPILFVLLGTPAMADEVGMHVGSWHSQGTYNNGNAGVYLEHNGFIVGTYYNSISRSSVYVGTRQVWGKLELTEGVVTGYGKPCPMLIPSLRYDVGDVRIRASLIPRTRNVGAYVVHLTVGKEF